MKKLLIGAVVATAVLAGAPAAQADYCPVFNPTNPKCLLPNADLMVCPVLAAFAGSYGEVTINAQGDVYVLGSLFWDCPPYEV